MDKKLEVSMILHNLASQFDYLNYPKTTVINTGRRKEKDMRKIEKAELKRQRKAQRNKQS
jgi:hypothetical protein